MLQERMVGGIADWNTQPNLSVKNRIKWQSENVQDIRTVECLKAGIHLYYKSHLLRNTELGLSPLRSPVGQSYQGDQRYL